MLINRAGRNWRLDCVPSATTPLSPHHDPGADPSARGPCVHLPPSSPLCISHSDWFSSFNLSYLEHPMFTSTKSSHPFYTLPPSIWIYDPILRTLHLEESVSKAFYYCDHYDHLRRKHLYLVNYVLTVTSWRQGPRPSFASQSKGCSHLVTPMGLERYADS